MPSAFNPFELLNIEPHYHVEEEMLLQHYQSIMKKLHPDQFLTQPEKDRAMILSAQVNDAYGILKDSLKRAEALLNILDIAIDSVSLDFESLENLMMLQEENDKQKIQEASEQAQAEFIVASQSQNKNMMQKSFLVMKYLRRSLEAVG